MRLGEDCFDGLCVRESPVDNECLRGILPAVVTEKGQELNESLLTLISQNCIGDDPRYPPFVHDASSVPNLSPMPWVMTCLLPAENS
jgi:hypothetical protein